MQTYNLEEAAKILKIHPETLRKLCKSGELLASKCGRSWVIREESIAQHILKNENLHLQEVQARKDEKCQSTCETTTVVFGTLISQPKAAKELDALLGQPTKRPRKNCTIN